MEAASRQGFHGTRQTPLLLLTANCLIASCLRFLIGSSIGRNAITSNEPVRLPKGTRLDGRKEDEIRPIDCEISYLPRAHGSALFTRGQTQSLGTTTLGTKMDEQLIDAREAAAAFVDPFARDSYRVFFFEKHDDHYFSPSTYPTEALACLTTHDLHTLAGWWSAHDLETRHQIGMIQTVDMPRERDERAHMRRRVLGLLHPDQRPLDRLDRCWGQPRASANARLRDL